MSVAGGVDYEGTEGSYQLDIHEDPQFSWVIIRVAPTTPIEVWLWRFGPSRKYRWEPDKDKGTLTGSVGKITLDLTVSDESNDPPLHIAGTITCP